MKLNQMLAIPLTVLAIGPAVLLSDAHQASAKKITLSTKVTKKVTQRNQANKRLVEKTLDAAKKRDAATIKKAQGQKHALVLHRYKLANAKDVLYRFSTQDGQYHAVYDRPGTLANAKVLKTVTQVDKLAHQESFGNYLYATQAIKTTRGSDYLYVKSFDGKVNGWIYAKALTQIDAVTSAKKAKYNKDETVYLNNVGQTSLYTKPLGTQKNPPIAVNNVYNYVSDPFKVVKTVTANRTKQVSVLVQDKNNSSVYGWIDQKNLSRSRDASQLKTFDSANMVKVKFIDAYDANKVVATANLPTGVNGKDQDVSNALKGTDKLGSNAWANAQLASYGYQYDPSLSANQAALSNVKNGDTVSLAVVNTKKVTSSFNVTAVDANGNLITTPVSLQADGVLGSDVVNLNKEYAQALNNVLTGNLNTVIPLNNVLSTINNSPVLGEIVGTQNYLAGPNGSEVYVNGNNLTDGAYHYVYRVDNDRTLAANTGVTYGQPLSLVYDKVRVDSPIVPTYATTGTTVWPWANTWGNTNVTWPWLNGNTTTNTSTVIDNRTKMPDNMIVNGGDDGYGDNNNSYSSNGGTTSNNNSGNASSQDAYDQGYTDATNNANGYD